MSGEWRGVEGEGEGREEEKEANTNNTAQFEDSVLLSQAKIACYPPEVVKSSGIHPLGEQLVLCTVLHQPTQEDMQGGSEQAASRRQSHDHHMTVT